MKVILLILLGFTGFAFADSDEGMTIAEEGQNFVSDGSRIYLQKEDISLVPPEGWRVKTNAAGMTAQFEMPKQDAEPIPRTIQIRAFDEAKYIDAVTAEKFAVDLEEKFSESDSSVNGYRLRSHIPVDMDDGSQGWLFYFGYSMNGVEVMQAHLLASSATRHYVITYTDVAENFVKETADEDYLGIAWSAMTSLQLPTKAPARLGLARIIGVALGFLAFFGIAFAFIRRKKAGKVYTQYADGKIPTGFGSTLYETHLKDDELEDVEVIVHTEYGEDSDDNQDLHFDESGDSIPESNHQTSTTEQKIG